MRTLKAAWLLDEVGNESIDPFGQWRGYHEKNVVFPMQVLYGVVKCYLHGMVRYRLALRCQLLYIMTGRMYPNYL